MPQLLPTPIILSAATISRRSLLLWGLSAGLVACHRAANGAANSPALKAAILTTPLQTQGPFYPIDEQQDKDTDLTQIEGRTHRAQGEVIVVKGRVMDTTGAAISTAFVEIWQANTWGRYRHQRDPNAAPLDPDFQGWGQTTTDAQGNYRFKTIKPGAYPAGPGWTRPPHIHFKVSGQGFFKLTTQMYFPGQALNKDDLILQNIPLAQQSSVIAKQQANNDNNEAVFNFDIVLLKKP